MTVEQKKIAAFLNVVCAFMSAYGVYRFAENHHPNLCMFAAVATCYFAWNALQYAKDNEDDQMK